MLLLINPFPTRVRNRQCFSDLRGLWNSLPVFYSRVRFFKFIYWDLEVYDFGPPKGSDISVKLFVLSKSKYNHKQGKYVEMLDCEVVTYKVQSICMLFL